MARSPKWNSKAPIERRNPTTDLFHVSDKHGISGIVPNFEAGESWDTLHQAAHERGEITKAHEHVSSWKEHRHDSETRGTG